MLTHLYDDAVFTRLDLPQKHNINIEVIKMTWNWISYLVGQCQ